MKKYSKVSELTETYLNGKLDRVLVEYENENTLVVSVSYAAGFNGVYNYSVKLNNNNEIDIYLKTKNQDKYKWIEYYSSLFKFDVKYNNFSEGASHTVVEAAEGRLP